MLVPAELRWGLSCTAAIATLMAGVGLLFGPSAEQVRERDLYRTSLDRMLSDDGTPRWGRKPGAPSAIQAAVPAQGPAATPARDPDQRPMPIPPGIRERLTTMDGGEGRTLRPGVPADPRLQDAWMRMMTDDGTPRWGYRRRGAAFEVPAVPSAPEAIGSPDR